MNDNKYLQLTIQIACQSVSDGGGPFGAIIVREGEIIGRGNNRVTVDNDPSAHAEIMAIRHACLTINNYELTGCTIYSSCEPCPMCLSAIYWSHLSRLVYSSKAEDAAHYGFDDAHIAQQLTLSESRRDVVTVCIKVQQAGEEFVAWKEKPDRIQY